MIIIIYTTVYIYILTSTVIIIGVAVVTIAITIIAILLFSLWTTHPRDAALDIAIFHGKFIIPMTTPRKLMCQ